MTCVQSALACPATCWIDCPCTLEWQLFLMLYQGDFTARERETASVVMHSAARNGLTLSCILRSRSSRGEKLFAMRSPNTMSQKVRVPPVCKLLIFLTAWVLNACNSELVLLRIWQNFLALSTKLITCFFSGFTFWLKDLLIWSCQMGEAHLVWQVHYNL